MRQNTSVISVCSLLFFWVSFGQSQESINSSGGDATSSGGSLAYSVGQVVYTTNSDISGTVSQGVQQAYEIFTLDIKEPTRNMSLSVFPNPTANNLTLQLENVITKDILYKLFDLQGRQLQKGEINTQQTQIYTSGLPSGVYLLKVTDQDGKNIQTYKIIKK